MLSLSLNVNVDLICVWVKCTVMVYPAAGVTVGEGCGWIRVFTTASKSSNSTLVYLNLQTTVKEISKDLVLPSESTLWLQVMQFFF